ncbi:hypothetical protein J8F10_11250 [Gemmata sp. G18]|uniref:Uncharacterized protein n=1 Tax=Gemmata palustris TaxID=2822762 RepID=A0ABS5BQ71_9BACT|nr:hypothetical protein [Gemmata palustris]MBP3955861.1 hypothetical protein [Gemmata palustris]
MPQMSESAAEKLTPQQATALTRVLDLQARWENHRDDPAKSASATADLQVRQKAFEAFRSAWREFTAEYRTAQLPEPTQNVPDRLAIWCRTLRAVLRRAESGSPAALVTKVHRLADRIAARVGKEPVGRGPVADLSEGIRELDAVIAWCEVPATLPGPVVAFPEGRKEEAA